MLVIRPEDTAAGTAGGGRATDNLSVEFTLRPMEPADGPALDALLTTQATATAVAMSTHYRYDVFASLIAQHPSLYGVVATAPGVDGLVGMATAYIDEVQVEDRLFPCAHLENLKVRDDVRRQGLGRKLAEWRIAEARRRFDVEGVIVAGRRSDERGFARHCPQVGRPDHGAAPDRDRPDDPKGVEPFGATGSAGSTTTTSRPLSRGRTRSMPMQTCIPA